MSHARIPLAIALVGALALLIPSTAAAKDTPVPKPEADATMRLAG